MVLGSNPGGPTTLVMTGDGSSFTHKQRARVGAVPYRGWFKSVDSSLCRSQRPALSPASALFDDQHLYVADICIGRPRHEQPATFRIKLVRVVVREVGIWIKSLGITHQLSGAGKLLAFPAVGIVLLL